MHVRICKSEGFSQLVSVRIRGSTYVCYESETPRPTNRLNLSLSLDMSFHHSSHIQCREACSSSKLYP